MSPARPALGVLPERETLEAILAASGRERQRLLDDFFRSKLKVFRSVGLYLCRKNSMDLARHADEATGIVAAECVVMVNEILANPDRLDQISSFDGKLWLRCRPVFRTYCDSAAGGVNASGAVALNRRKRELGRTREALRASYDREPTNPEIIEATNTKMLATRKDAGRQSMICAMDDLLTDPVAYSLVDHDVADSTDDPLLAAHEATKLIRSVVAVAEQTSVVLGAVARAWVGDLYNPEVQTVRTPAQIAEHLNMTPAAVSRQLAHLRVVARSYLADMMAITEDVYQGGQMEDGVYEGA